MWLPTPFIGYFSHHDGLMVTTVSQLQNAIRHGGQWPFNQYGSFWAFVYAIPTWDIKHEYLLVSMRLMTLLFYFITTWLTYRIARLFGGRNFATAAAIILLSNQAFLFDLLPWPSAVAMPMITFIAYLLLRKMTVARMSQLRIITEVVLVGILIPMVILTRIQIGVLLFIISLFFIHFFGGKKQAAIFLLSFLTSTGIFFSYLATHGWLIPSLQDQILFGSSYLRNDANPVPIFTAVGVAGVMLLLGSSNKIKTILADIRNKPKIILQIVLFFSIFLAGVLLVMVRRSMNPYSMYLLVVHRLWISLLLGGIIYFSFGQAKKSYLAWQKGEFFNKDLQKMNLLSLLSLTSQIQIFPLFDQMHSWWGSTPGVVIILLLFKDKYQLPDKSGYQEKNVAKISFISFLLLSLIPFSIQTWNLEKLSTTPFFRGVYVSQNTSRDISTLQNIFKKNINRGTKVLNLCPDPDVFLNPYLARSEPRVFIFWSEFFSSKYLRETFQESQPQIIISCFSPGNKAIDLKAFQENFNNDSRNAVLIYSTRNLLGHDWQIWKI